MNGRGFGHAFIEAYASDLQKWILIDPIHSVFLRSLESEEPQSLYELLGVIAAGKRRSIEVVKLHSKAGRADYAERYLQNHYHYFVLANYHLELQYRWLRACSMIPFPIVHTLMFVVGHYHRFLKFDLSENAATSRSGMSPAVSIDACR